MTDPVFFTVTADYRSVVADLASDSDYDPTIGPVSATVTFTPVLRNGDVILATQASPRPIGYLPAPVVARIDVETGRLMLRVDPDAGGTGTFAPVRLLANSALLELDTPLHYRVSFSNVVFNGKPGFINSFIFEAPSTDTEINLIEVSPIPNSQPAGGITKIAPGTVRLEDGNVIFGFGGVDIPEPIPFTPEFTSTEMTDSTATGRAVITAANAAAARTAIGAENAAMKGASGGYAPLDSTAKIDAAYLPSYVDDVLSYANQAAFPGTGESGKIYVAQDTGDAFRWTGSAYLRISDRVTAAGITDSTTVGRAVVTAASAVAARTAIGLTGINVKTDHGAVGDGTTNDAAAIQAAINAARDAIRADYTNTVAVIIPAGVYRINSRIVHPPYVKVTTTGSVVFKSYVSSDSCWHITPLSDDPDPLYAAFNKQQWIAGAPLNGANGGISFINSGTVGTGTGLELGSRTDLGVRRPLCRYGLNDITIQGYDIGLQWNCFRHYIAAYDRIHIENNRKAVYIGDGTDAGVDSGENITWRNSLFASATSDSLFTYGTDPLITWGNSAIDMNFVACSFDFATTVFKFNYGYQKVNVFGGHIEGINGTLWETETGGIVVSTTDALALPDLTLHSVPFVSNGYGVQFRGPMILDLGMTYRYATVTSTDVEYARSYLCDSSVQVIRHRYRNQLPGPNISRALNTVLDPLFAADSVSTAGSSLTYWDNDVAGGTRTVTVDADSPVDGGKSLKHLMTGAVYSRYTTKTYLPCAPGDRIYSSYAYKLSATTPAPVMTIAMSFYDSEKVQIGTTTQTDLFRTVTVSGKWAVSNVPTESLAPAGACFYKVGFQISTSSGDGVTEYRISDFHSYIGQ